ncbi:MAG: ATP-binding protein [Cyanobacteriota bacterium]
MLSAQLLENQAVPTKNEEKNQAVTVAAMKRWIKQLFLNATIRRKIGAGYALCVGVAILGTSAGLMLGEHYQTQAMQAMARTHQQEDLLRALQMAVLQARSHASRLADAVGNEVWLQYEHEAFKNSIKNAQQELIQTKGFVNNRDNQTLTNYNQLHNLLERYAIAVNAYSNFTESLLREVDAAKVKPHEIFFAQQQLLRNNSGEVAIALDQLSEQLTQMIATAQTQHQQSTFILEQAGALRVKIIAASMLLSVFVAALLALYTSNAIVQPIRSVTNVAQNVADESNFALRAPVMTEDEVGVLATSLNQLIERIAAYTEELKQAQAQLIQTEKMTSLGAMVAGVAHEINNPVNFIYGNLDYASDYIQDLLSLLRLYQQSYPEPQPAIQQQFEDIDFDFLAEDLPKILSSMKVGANRIREIVLSLRNFSRLDEEGMKRVNLHEGIENTLLLLNNRLQQRIQVNKEYGELPLVECCPAQINQVFMNLLCNAIDALEMPTRDREQETSNRSIQSSKWTSIGSCYSYKKGCTNTKKPQNYQSTIPMIRIRTEVSEQNWVVIRISDNGCGIPPAIQNRIFDPFFTTKEPGKGTGLGLTISYQIITQHQGTIEVNSLQSQGTEFVIRLPVETRK